MGNKRNLSRNYFKYINSTKWFNKRKEALEHHGKRCHKCKSKEHLDVHHLTYERFGNEFLSDLMVLCRTCHTDEHSKYKINSTPKLKPYVSPTKNRKGNAKLNMEYRIRMLKRNKPPMKMP